MPPRKQKQSLVSEDVHELRQRVMRLQRTTEEAKAESTHLRGEVNDLKRHNDALLAALRSINDVEGTITGNKFAALERALKHLVK